VPTKGIIAQIRKGINNYAGFDDSRDGSNGINIRKDKQAEGVREIEPRQRQEGSREDEGGERQSKQTDRSLSKRGIQKRGREPKRRDRSDQARFWR
jgi:hypothetical protein